MRRPAGQRSATAAGRREAPLPGFIVIGAMRAATTTLHRCLASHPGIGMSRAKETDYFVAERNFGRGPAWYRRQFPRGRAVTGEVSPNYAKFDIFPGVPARIRAALPDVRLVYLVRDPVARAVSHYRFAASLGTAGSTPEAERIRHMIVTSRYLGQIERYLEHFDGDRILVLDCQDLASRPAETVDRIARFVGAGEGTAATGVVRANSSDHLAGLPPWFTALRRTGLGARLRECLPETAVDGLRRLVSGPAPALPPVPAEVVDRFRGELAEEADRFRAWAGQPFPSWTV